MNKYKESLGAIKSYIYRCKLNIKENIKASFKKKPTVKSIDETIKYIVENKCSVSRLGDGEIFIIDKSGEIGFQRFNLELSIRLSEILKSNQRNHIVCIPKVFSNNDLKVRTEKSKEFWKEHLIKYRDTWYNNIDFNNVYYDANFTRNYIVLEDKSFSSLYFESIKSIWKDRNVLIVEGEKTRMGIGNDLFKFSKSIKRILAPSENAFDKYNNILDCIKNKYEKDDLVLIALGPTATVLAYDLSKIEIQAIDIGHIDVEYEWYLQGATEKVKLNNKYVNEVAEGRCNIEDIEEDEYINQICYVIK